MFTARKIKVLWIFYKRTLLPALILSLLLATFSFSPSELYIGAGIAFVFIFPFFHYMMYEIRSPEDYFFYHNLGFSKTALWICTVSISSLVKLISVIL